MDGWVRLCAVQQAPEPGQVMEAEVAGKALCVANIEGTLHAVDNLCPHRDGPLGQGWVEGNRVVCPWHCWEFDVVSGQAQPPEHASIAVFPVRIEGEEVLVQLG